jgi:hypothetical protein
MDLRLRVEDTATFSGIPRDNPLGVVRQKNGLSREPGGYTQ